MMLSPRLLFHAAAHQHHISIIQQFTADHTPLLSVAESKMTAGAVQTSNRSRNWASPQCWNPSPKLYTSFA